jgi:hypothetical protein
MKKRHLLDEALYFCGRHQHAVLGNLTVEICISLTELGLLKNRAAKLFPRKDVIIHLNLGNFAFLLMQLRDEGICLLKFK